MKIKLVKNKSVVYAGILVLVLVGAGFAYYFLQNSDSPANNEKGKKVVADCKELAKALKNDEAVSCYNAVLQDDAQNVDAKANLANVYFEEKKYDESSKLLTEVNEARPADAFVLNNLANSLRDQGKTEEAISYYNEAIKAGNSDSISNLVTVYNIAGEYDKSIALLNDQLEGKPEDRVLTQLLASTYSKSGNQVKANELLSELN